MKVIVDNDGNVPKAALPVADKLGITKNMGIDDIQKSVFNMKLVDTLKLRENGVINHATDVAISGLSLSDNIVKIAPVEHEAHRQALTESQKR